MPLSDEQLESIQKSMVEAVSDDGAYIGVLGPDEVRLDGFFTANDLETIANLLRAG